MTFDIFCIFLYFIYHNGISLITHKLDKLKYIGKILMPGTLYACNYYKGNI